MVYAGASKNIGPAGLTVMVVRKDLIGHAPKDTPVMLDLKNHEKASGMFYNTPGCWSIYIAGLNIAYMKQQGIEKIEELNKFKAKLVYDAIDNSDGYYQTVVYPKYRSKMNIPFRVCNDKQLEKKFAEDAIKEGMIELAGHVFVGACRASIYNAMPVEGVLKLVKFMKDFRENNPVAPPKL